MSGGAKRPGSGLILPSDPSFYELPPPPGSGPSLEERLSRLVEPDAEEERGAEDDAEWVDAVPGTVDAHVELEDEQALDELNRARRGWPIERLVLVQPEDLAGDHLILRRGLSELADRDGLEGAVRGVAAIDPGASGAEIEELTALGVVMTRFAMAADAPRLAWGELSRIAARVHDLAGWGVSLAMDGRYLGEVERMVREWPGPVLLEAGGGFARPVGGNDPGFRAMMRLVEADRLWVSLAGRVQPGIARVLLRNTAERVVWGSGWPEHDPEDAYERLGELAEDEGLRRLVTVGNPSRLFGFELPA